MDQAAQRRNLEPYMDDFPLLSNIVDLWDS